MCLAAGNFVFYVAQEGSKKSIKIRGKGDENLVKGKDFPVIFCESFVNQGLILLVSAICQDLKISRKCLASDVVEIYCPIFVQYRKAVKAFSDAVHQSHVRF